MARPADTDPPGELMYKEISLSDLDKCDEILNYLKDLSVNQRKTILSGLVVIS